MRTGNNKLLSSVLVFVVIMLATLAVSNLAHRQAVKIENRQFAQYYAYNAIPKGLGPALRDITEVQSVDGYIDDLVYAANFGKTAYSDPYVSWVVTAHTEDLCKVDFENTRAYGFVDFTRTSSDGIVYTEQIDTLMYPLVPVGVETSFSKTYQSEVDMEEVIVYFTLTVHKEVCDYNTFVISVVAK